MILKLVFFNWRPPLQNHLFLANSHLRTISLNQEDRRETLVRVSILFMRYLYSGWQEKMKGVHDFTLNKKYLENIWHNWIYGYLHERELQLFKR